MLNSQNIKNLSFLNIPGGLKEAKPKLLKLDNFINNMKIVHEEDKALDGAHPGLGSHASQAALILEAIYDKMKA